jgi:GTPase SAR1 family protein
MLERNHTRDNKPKPMYTLVILGDAGIGKTMLARNAQGLPYHPTYVPTIGVDVFNATVYDTDFKIVDCAGQKRFEGLGKGYYIGADCAIVMAYNSENASEWIRKFRSVRGNENVPVEVIDRDYSFSVFKRLVDRLTLN